MRKRFSEDDINVISLRIELGHYIFVDCPTAEEVDRLILVEKMKEEVQGTYKAKYILEKEPVSSWPSATDFKKWKNHVVFASGWYWLKIHGFWHHCYNL